MKLKTLVAASALALASAGVHATSTLTGPGTPAMLYDGDSTSVSHTQGAFTDNWTLIVDEGTGAADVSISFADFPFTFMGLSFEITGMNISGNPTFAGSNDSFVFTGSLLNDTYNISVAGLASGNAGGLYSAALNATPTAAPVPVPPAALLFGSALVGLAGLKRKKAAKELVEA